MQISEIPGKLEKSLANRGAFGTVSFCVAKLLGCFKPSHWRTKTLARARDLEFDNAWGVDTSGILEPDKSDVQGENWIHGTRYQAVDPTDFMKVMNGLALDFGQFTFIDFGSGKGRAVLLASNYPLKKAIGVEYSEPLTQIARNNVRRYPDDRKKCHTIEMVCADATEFPIPAGPLILFMNNPFAMPLMQKLIHNVETSFQANPRRIIVIYFTAQSAALWDTVEILHRTQNSEHRYIAVYDTLKQASNQA